MKLSTRLVLLFLLLSLVPLWSIGYLAYLNGIKTIKESTIDRLISINMIKAAEVSQWINSSSTHLQTLAQRPLVRQYTKRLTVDLNNLPSDESEQIRDKLIADHFAPSVSFATGFLDLSLLNLKDGRIIASTLKALEGRYRTNRSFFIEGQKQTYVAEMVYEVGLEQLAMHISTPVRDEGGQTIAVLAGHLDWGVISQIMAQGSERSRSEESYLVNKFNYFVTDSRFLADYQLKKTIHTLGVNLCLLKEEGVALYNDYRSIPVIGAFRWMEKWDLCIMTEVDQGEAFEPVATSRMIFVAVGVSAALVTMIFSFLFTRTITRRIDRLVIGADEIGKGNLNHRLYASGNDEIDQLARSFNDMAHARKKSENRIKKAYDEMEDRVTERTAELSYKNLQLLDEIKERRQAELALRESEQKYRLLLDILDTAVVVHAADTRVIMSNQRSHQLLGLSEEQMVGKKSIDPAWHFTREDNSAMPLEEYPVNLVLKTGKPLRNYTAGIMKPQTDEVTWVSVNAFPELDTKGRVIQVVVTFWDITFRKIAEAKMQSSLNEKEVLLREIHHRVKNNMQMIQSLINLQAKKMKSTSFKQALTDSNSRIKSMALIHEMLYRSENLSTLDLEKYFQQLVKHLLKLYHNTNIRIEIKYDIEPIVLDMDSSIACGLIVNELVTNALKYAFMEKQQNVLAITLHKVDGNTAELVVADNGKGLPGELEVITRQSLGLQIVTMLAVDQLQGSLSTDTTEGAQFCIRFSLK